MLLRKLVSLYFWQGDGTAGGGWRSASAPEDGISILNGAGEVSKFVL